MDCNPTFRDLHKWVSTVRCERPTRMIFVLPQPGGSPGERQSEGPDLLLLPINDLYVDTIY